MSPNVSCGSNKASPDNDTGTSIFCLPLRRATQGYHSCNVNLGVEIGDEGTSARVWQGISRCAGKHTN
jgi:hypothetical protein